MDNAHTPTHNNKPRWSVSAFVLLAVALFSVIALRSIAATVILMAIVIAVLAVVHLAGRKKH